MFLGFGDAGDEDLFGAAVGGVPDAGVYYAEAAEYSAVTLFAQRAAAADRRFELSSANTGLVAAICRRLDGNPLADITNTRRIRAVVANGRIYTSAELARLATEVVRSLPRPKDR